MLRAMLSACLLGAVLPACSPALNWRQVELEAAGPRITLPCKPDRASRETELLGRRHELRMAGCEAGGALFAVSSLDLADAGARLDQAQAQWQAAMLRAMQADGPAQVLAAQSLRLPASSGMPAVWLSARGARPDGGVVQAQALWFARGTRLYHAAVYAERLTPELTEPFFGGWSAP